MVSLLMILPWVFRGIGIVSALVGLLQGQQVASGQYGASPGNLGAIGAWLAASAGSWIAAYLTKPTNFNTLKTALDHVFKYVHKAKIDPNNTTDLDERAMAFLEDYTLKLLTALIARWSPEAQAKAAALISDIKYCQLVEQTGQAPSGETVTALASVAPRRSPGR